MENNILITGGAGFLGSHIVDTLISQKVPKSNIYIPRSKNYDLRNRLDVEKMFDDYPKINKVIHLANISGGIDFYKKYPGKMFFDNLIMGLNLMDIAKRRGIEKMVIVGTGLAYPKDAKIPLKEDSIWEGFPEENAAPYGMASRTLLAQSQIYKKEGFNSIYVIPANLYGPKDNFNPELAHVIPATILKIDKAIKQKEKEIIMGGGENSREFLYVKDAAEGVVLAMNKYNDSRPLNIGNGEDIKLRTVAKKLAEIMGFSGKIKWGPGIGQSRRCFDISRAKKELGFKAKIKLDEGLKKTVKYFNSLK